MQILIFGRLASRFICYIFISLFLNAQSQENQKTIVNDYILFGNEYIYMKKTSKDSLSFEFQIKSNDMLKCIRKFIYMPLVKPNIGKDLIYYYNYYYYDDSIEVFAYLDAEKKNLSYKSVFFLENSIIIKSIMYKTMNKDTLEMLTEYKYTISSNAINIEFVTDGILSRKHQLCFVDNKIVEIKNNSQLMFQFIDRNTYKLRVANCIIKKRETKVLSGSQKKYVFKFELTE